MKLPACLLLSAAFAVATASAADYHVVAHYKIGGDTSGYDYLKVDADARRVYASHEKRFEVLDADTGQKVGEIGPATRAHGVAIAHEAGHGFASSGIDDTITMFDLKTLATIKQIKSTGSNPDSIEYDPASNHVYAANHGSGDVTVIDPVTGDVVATVKLGDSKLEGIAFDGRGQAFVNAEDKSAVHVFDTQTLKLKATWPAAPGEGGTGLACDAAHHRLFSACGNNKIAVLDSDTGKLITTIASGEDPDGLVFDAKSGRIFTSNPDGTMTVIQQDSADKYSALATVKTETGCKTLALDAKTGRIFTSAPKFGPKPAPVKGGRPPKAPILADSFQIVVVGQ